MNDWYKEWFSSELYLSVYSHRNDEDAEKLCRLILSSAYLPKGAKILDAACGAGRHSNRFSLLGFDVAGFDLSRTLLKKAVKSAKEKNLNTKFLCSDLRNVPLKNNFDLIVNLFTSFGYFESDEENFSFVKQAYSLLNEKGFYILDYLNEKTLRKNLVKQSERDISGNRVIERRRISGSRVIKEINVFNKEQNLKFFESVRLYSKDEILEKAKGFGFFIHKIYGDYNGGEFSENNSHRLIMV
ncbi:MAG: class I SAM-dependent methyltransferase, partial [Bacteroidota bacterium]